MRKIFNGKIVILRAKTNSGIVLLEDGSETQSIKFPNIFNDKDEVEISFIDDNPLSDIESMDFKSDDKNYGFIKYYNQLLQQGEIIGKYPAAISNIKFNLKDNPKLFPTILNDIKRWALNIENLIKELEQISKTSKNKRNATKDLTKLGTLVKDHSIIDKIIYSLNVFLKGLQTEINSESYIKADKALIGILHYLKTNNDHLQDIKSIPVTKRILKKIMGLDQFSQFDKKDGVNVSFQIIKKMDDKHIKAKNIHILSTKSKDQAKVVTPSYGRIIKKHDKYFWTNFNRIEVGQRFEAKVTGQQDYGVFIETIFGHKGLVFNSQLSWDNDNDTEVIPSVGENIVVKLIYIDQDGKLSFSIKRLFTQPWGIEMKQILVTEESFKNFIGVDPMDIYYFYNIKEKIEVYKLNQNNLAELIPCYKHKGTPIKMKYQIIDTLINMDLHIKGFSKSELLNDKIQILKNLINEHDDFRDKKKFVYELMKIDYDYDYIKMVTKGEGEDLTVERVEIPDNYNTNKSINDILDKDNLKKEDLSSIKSYKSNNSIKGLLL